MVLTTISVEKSTRDLLKKMGDKGDTYDVILRRLITIAHNQK